MKKRLLLAVTAVLLGTSALLPSQAMAQVSVNVHIGTAPPPLRYEHAPPPRSGYIWAPGYWDWNGRQHIWAGGHWERARSGYRYDHPVWRQDRGQWHLHKGGWKPKHPQHKVKKIKHKQKHHQPRRSQKHGHQHGHR